MRFQEIFIDYSINFQQTSFLINTVLQIELHNYEQIPEASAAELGPPEKKIPVSFLLTRMPVLYATQISKICIMGIENFLKIWLRLRLKFGSSA